MLDKISQHVANKTLGYQKTGKKLVALVKRVCWMGGILTSWLYCLSAQDPLMYSQTRVPWKVLLGIAPNGTSKDLDSPFPTVQARNYPKLKTQPGWKIADDEQGQELRSDQSRAPFLVLPRTDTASSLFTCVMQRVGCARVTGRDTEVKQPPR